MIVGNIMAESKWELQKLGKFGASQIDFLFTEPRSKKAKDAGELGEVAKTYIKKKASEIITGTIRQVYAWSMEWGNQWEPHAANKLKDLYPDMEYMGKEQPRFFKYSDFSGGSPDGVDFRNKIVFEIKCPEDPENHVEYCLFNSADDLRDADRQYYHQIQMNMVCVAREWGYDFFDMMAVFASYCPLVNEPYFDLKTLVIYPDQEFYEKLPGIIERAENYLADIVWKLNKNNQQFSTIIAHHNEELHATIIES